MLYKVKPIIIGAHEDDDDATVAFGAVVLAAAAVFAAPAGPTVTTIIVLIHHITRENTVSPIFSQSIISRCKHLEMCFYQSLRSALNRFFRML